MIVPVAAVALTVVVSAALTSTSANVLVEPLNVCVAVNVVAVPGATKSVPAVAAVKADVPLPFNTPVNVVAPVPPLATLSVPANVTAPVVAVDGVNPVVPALNDATVLDVVANVPLVGNVTLVLADNVPVNV